MAYIVKDREDLAKKFSEAGDKLIVIDFFANWCGPCKIIAPKLEELSALYAEKAVVLKVDVDDCEDIALEYNVSSMPTFLFIKNQQVIDVFVGGNAERLEKTMEKWVLDIATTPIAADANAQPEINVAATGGTAATETIAASETTTEDLLTQQSPLRS